MRTIYTIGHSTHPIEKFVRLLEDRGITLVVDVRSTPYSRHCPQFNREQLAHSLQEHGIEYAYAGRYLGGRPDKPSCYKRGVVPQEGKRGEEEQKIDYLHEVNYREVMKRAEFQQGIRQLLELAEEHVVGIMCSEEDPAKCHRHYLIAVYLADQYPAEVEVIHIRGDGSEFPARQLPDDVPEPIQAEQKPLF